MTTPNNIEVVKVIDPELRLNNQRRYVSVQGSQTTNTVVYTAPNVNNSQIQIECNPLNQDIATSRLVLRKAVFQCNITGTNTTMGPLLLDGAIAPRAYPLTSVIATESWRIGNSNPSQSPINLMWPAMLNYGTTLDQRVRQLSTTQPTLDNFQNYSDGFGSALNPLLGYNGSSSLYEPGRASVGFDYLNNANAGTTASVQITTIEPVMVSPYEYEYYKPAFVSLQTMNYYATLVGNLNRVLSTIIAPASGVTLTNIVSNLIQFQLEFVYLTPSVSEPIPKQLVLPYYTVTDYTTTYNGTCAPGQTITFNMSSVNLGGIPKRMYIFAGHNPADIANDTLGQLSDTYLSFAPNTPLFLSFSNQNFFTTYTTENLYQIMVRNGYQGSFAQAFGYTVNGVPKHGHRGTVLALDPGVDWGLAHNQAPGSMGSYNFYIQLNVLNTNPTYTYNSPYLHCIAVYEGIFSIDNSLTATNTSILTSADVENADKVAGVHYERQKDIYGGGLFPGLLGLLGKIPEFLRNTKLVSSIASAIPHPAGQVVGSVANALGFSQHQRQRSQGQGAYGTGALAGRIRGRGLDID